MGEEAVIRHAERKLCKEYERRIRIITAEVHEKMLKVAVRLACEGLQKKKDPSDIAEAIVRAFKKAMKHAHWHCIIGKRYGSNVSHEQGYYLYFYVDQLAVMLFRTRERCEREDDYYD
uniref:Dynein light chain n=1 Tax=Trichuris muris TaxID=70415 RepID=A0A5S6R163_TRIMR